MLFLRPSTFQSAIQYCALVRTQCGFRLTRDGEKESFRELIINDSNGKH